MKKLALVCSLMLVLIPAVLAGCTHTIGTIPTNLREFSFTDMWNKLVNATGVNEESTHLFDFTLHIGKNGSLDALYFSFHGSDTTGRNKLYNVDIDTTGGIRTEAYSAGLPDMNQQTVSPSYFFDALDKANLSEMFDANTTTYILARSYSGDIGYGNGLPGLYLLDEGRLTPLKKIIFHSSIPWLPIEIYNMTDTVVGASIGETWFLPRDMGMATDVEYAEPSEPGFGIYLVDTGELVLSEQDIRSYNASTHEIELDLMGARKWNSYINVTENIPTLADTILFAKDFVIKVNGEEIYRGKFWSMVSSQSYDGIVMLDALFTRDNENSKIWIESSYPASNSSNDSMNDPRITDFFEKEGLIAERSFSLPETGNAAIFRNR
jgi:hypothetical protein